MVSTEASAESVGVMLQQDITEELRPLASFDKCLNASQCSYSAFDTKFLAVYEASLRYFVEGREFHALTDHKPLKHTMDQTGDNLSGESAARLYL